MSDKEEIKMTENKPYTLRRLTGDDLWPVLEIAGKIMPDDLMPYFVGIATEGKSVDDIGGEVIYRMVTAIIKDIGKVKNEVYSFLTSVSGLTRDEINALGLVAIPKMIWEIYNAEKDFFGA